MVKVDKKKIHNEYHGYVQYISKQLNNEEEISFANKTYWW